MPRNRKARDVVTLAEASGSELSEMSNFERLERQLLNEFSPPLPPEEVRRHLLASISSYQRAVVRSYLPLLIERSTRERLRALVATREV